MSTYGCLPYPFQNPKNVDKFFFFKAIPSWMTKYGYFMKNGSQKKIIYMKKTELKIYRHGLKIFPKRRKSTVTEVGDRYLLFLFLIIF